MAIQFQPTHARPDLICSQCDTPLLVNVVAHPLVGQEGVLVHPIHEECIKRWIVNYRPCCYECGVDVDYYPLFRSYFSSSLRSAAGILFSLYVFSICQNTCPEPDLLLTTVNTLFILIVGGVKFTPPTFSFLEDMWICLSTMVITCSLDQISKR